MIAGAAGGLGQFVTRDLAAAGMKVALLGSHVRPLQALGAELRLADDRWMAAAADLKKAALAKKAVASVVERFGRVDILIHLVGGYHGGESVVDTRDAEVAAMLSQHLWTTLNMARAVVPHMTAGGWGRIVAVSSPLASAPTKNVAPYAIGKAAEEALLSTLAREMAGTGTTVNMVLVRTIDVDHERDGAPSSKNASWTTPEEISATIRHLVSEDAAPINGAKIPLYGNA